MITITATQLACAVLDSSWRQNWLAGKNPSTRLFSSSEGPVHGAEFHEIVAQFTHWLVEPDHRRRTAPLTTGEALFDVCYDQFAAAPFAALLCKRPEGCDSVLALNEALRHFCDHLAQLRKALPFCKQWSELYLSVEGNAKPGIFNFGSTTIQVRGRWDAVRRHPSQSHEVVDYKLSKGHNLRHDLVQLAIYAQLLHQQLPDSRFVGTLEYYLPHLQKQAVNRDELFALFSELVLPVLDELAHGFPQTPDLSQPPHQPSLAGPPVAREEGADPMAERIVAAFTNFKLKVAVTGRIEAPQLVRYQLLPDAGVKTVSLASRAKDLMVHLNLAATPVINAAPGMVTLDIPKTVPDSVPWSQWVHDHQLTKAGRLAFPVGLGVDNRLLIADLAEPNQCHLLVAGATGSGKSVFLQAVLASLMQRNTPKTLRLLIVDPKLVSFTALEGSPFLEREIVTGLEETLERLEMAVAEMERRTKLLKQANLQNVHQWQQRGDCPHPFWVIVFDEFADLILVGGQEKKRFESMVSRLAGKARAVGIHLILATQRPDKEIVTGLIKANLQLKICLRVSNGLNSSIILGETGGENLLGKGDLLVNLGPTLQRGQALYVDHQTLSAVAQRRDG